MLHTFVEFMLLITGSTGDENEHTRGIVWDEKFTNPDPTASASAYSTLAGKVFVYSLVLLLAA